MRSVGTRILIFLSVGIGGGSLLLFAYFLPFGSPIATELAHSHSTRLGFDSLLCLAFFLQHSGMVRRSAKDRLAKRIPTLYHPALYSVASGAALITLVLLWQPTDQFLFHLRGLTRWLSLCVYLLAIAGFAWGVQALPDFDPFGVLPLEARLRGTPTPPFPFAVRGPYRFVRHPLYFFMLVLIWSTPRLSTDQLLFNVLWTAWVIVGTTLEERDLLAQFGQTYRQYQLSVPMLLPSPRLLLRRSHSNSAA